MKHTLFLVRFNYQWLHVVNASHIVASPTNCQLKCTQILYKKRFDESRRRNAKDEYASIASMEYIEPRRKLGVKFIEVGTVR